MPTQIHLSAAPRESSRRQPKSPQHRRAPEHRRMIMDTGPLESAECRLVVQDHLRFVGVLALGFLAELNQPLGIKPAVGVALESARCPGEIDEKATEDVTREGAIGLWAARRRLQNPEPQSADRLVQVAREDAIAILKQEFVLISTPRHLSQLLQCPSRGRRFAPPCRNLWTTMDARSASALVSASAGRAAVISARLRGACAPSPNPAARFSPSRRVLLLPPPPKARRSTASRPRARLAHRRLRAPRVLRALG